MYKETRIDLDDFCEKLYDYIMNSYRDLDDLSTIRKIKEHAISTVISNITVSFEWGGPLQAGQEELFLGPTWCIFQKMYQMENGYVISMSVEADNQEQFENDIIQLKLGM